jgi:hypothetical protein
MFNRTVEERLTAWIELRAAIECSTTPLEDVWEFWKSAPFIPHNRNVDPYYQGSWPSPWEIIAENKYDDFTKALMIAWTLKLTKKFSNSHIELKTLVDFSRVKEYNIVYVDNSQVLNYSDFGPISAEKVPESAKLENLIDIVAPR